MSYVETQLPSTGYASSKFIARAWTLPQSTSAVEAAGKIHSNIARGFIRAETVAFDDFKAAGRVRVEGREYPVADGDCIHYRYSV